MGSKTELGTGSALAESRWRPLAFVACLSAITAAGLLYANLELAGDLFWLLAAGRHVDVHGVTGTDPFLTIAHGGHWYNQQWLSEWLIFRLERLGGAQGGSVALPVPPRPPPLAGRGGGRAPTG